MKVGDLLTLPPDKQFAEIVSREVKAGGRPETVTDRILTELPPTTREWVLWNGVETKVREILGGGEAPAPAVPARSARWDGIRENRDFLDRLIPLGAGESKRLRECSAADLFEASDYANHRAAAFQRRAGGLSRLAEALKSQGVETVEQLDLDRVKGLLDA